MNSTDPSAWPLDEFPHPNPYFPAPPRGGVPWRWWVLLSSAAASVSLLVYCFQAPPEQGSFVVIAALALVVTTAVTLWLVKPTLSARIWRNAEILPAVVVRAPNEGMFVEAPVSLSISGILSTLFFQHIYDPGEVSAKVEYVRGGKRRVARIRALGPESELMVGQVIWIILHGPPGRAIPSDRVAPDDQFGLQIPKDVQEWLPRALEAGSEADSAVDTEYLEAARANAEAFKRARHNEQ